MVFQQFGGINGVSFYASSILETAGKILRFTEQDFPQKLKSLNMMTQDSQLTMEL